MATFKVYITNLLFVPIAIIGVTGVAFIKTGELMIGVGELITKWCFDISERIGIALNK